MIVVSGTGRSGTSMWMQMLRAGGLPVVGEAFPLDWAETLSGANPRGFYESTLLNGINTTTNPNPYTGALLRPEETRHVAVKVFARGVVRTQRPFLTRVVVSVRHWRAYVSSRERIIALYNPHRDAPVDPSPLASTLEWWTSHYLLLQDAVLRGYRTRFVRYEPVLQDPSRIAGPILDWLDVPLDRDAALAVIEPGLKTQDPATGADIPDAWIPVRPGGRHAGRVVERRTPHQCRPGVASAIRTPDPDRSFG